MVSLIVEEIAGEVKGARMHKVNVNKQLRLLHCVKVMSIPVLPVIREELWVSYFTEFVQWPYHIRKAFYHGTRSKVFNIEVLAGQICKHRGINMQGFSVFFVLIYMPKMYYDIEPAAPRSIKSPISAINYRGLPYGNPLIIAYSNLYSKRFALPICVLLIPWRERRK